MAGFAEAQSCRRRVLLGYFGEKLEHDCGNCDICLNPPQVVDVTTQARQALSCVFRVGQRFGMGYVIDVLLGSRNQRLLSLGHDRLSTYGIGREESREFWSALLRHLIHYDYLFQDVANYSVLKLTPASKPLLRGEQSLSMARPRPRAEPARKKRPKKIAAMDYDSDLFEKLRVLRKEIADAANVPPFVVFSDATLAEMSALRPVDKEAMLEINGVGQHKLAKYGDDFINAIMEFSE